MNQSKILRRNEALNIETVRHIMKNLLLLNLIKERDFNSWIQTFFDKLNIAYIVQFITVMKTLNYLQNSKMNMLCNKIHFILMDIETREKSQFKKIDTTCKFTDDDIKIFMDWSNDVTRFKDFSKESNWLLIPGFITEMYLNGLNHYVFTIQIYAQKDILLDSFENKELEYVLHDWPIGEMFIKQFNRKKNEKIWNVYLHCKQVEKLNSTSNYIDVIILCSDQIFYKELSVNWKEIISHIENYNLKCCNYSIIDFRQKFLENGRFDFLQSDKIHTVIHYVQNLNFEETQLELLLLPCFF